MSRPLRLAIAGLGTIGLEVARYVDAGCIEGMMLTAIAARNQDKARALLSGFTQAPELRPLTELARETDVIVECAPASVFRDIVEPALEHGRIVVPLSVGMLLDNMDLIDLAKRTGGRIIVPTGALLGLDAVRAAARGNVLSVRMMTRKPPAGLEGAPYLQRSGLSVAGLTQPKLLFVGSAREAAKGFPANLNVGAALALAGIGPDETTIEIWADPTLKHNTHTIEVKSDSSNFTMTIQNTPSENPRTGKITALSVIVALERLTAPLTIGS